MFDFSEWSRSDTLALWALLVSAASLVIAIGIPAFSAFSRRPRMQLKTKWTHPNFRALAAGEEVRQFDPAPMHYCEFELINTGSSPNQINDVDLIGKGDDCVNVSLSRLTIGGSDKYLKLPCSLAPGQAFRFTYHFSPDDFLKMRRSRHYLNVRANRLYKFKLNMTND